MTQHSWPAIGLARACDGPARIPFVLMNEQGPVLGSVAIRHLATLHFAVRRGPLEPDPSDPESTAAALTAARRQAFESLRSRPFGAL